MYKQVVVDAVGIYLNIIFRLYAYLVCVYVPVFRYVFSVRRWHADVNKRKAGTAKYMILYYSGESTIVKYRGTREVQRSAQLNARGVQRDFARNSSSVCGRVPSNSRAALVLLLLLQECKRRKKEDEQSRRSTYIPSRHATTTTANPSIVHKWPSSQRNKKKSEKKQRKAKAKKAAIHGVKTKNPYKDSKTSNIQFGVFEY